MKTVVLKCGACSTSFERVKKEIDRQRRKGRRKFYCSRQCAGRIGEHAHLAKYGRTSENLERLARYRDEMQLSRPRNPFRRYISRLRSRIEESPKPHQFDLTVEDLEAIWIRQGGRCAFSGLAMKLKGQGTYFEQASLDRIDSMAGYTKDNVQFVLLPLNLAKGEKDNADFIRFMDQLTNVAKATK